MLAMSKIRVRRAQPGDIEGILAIEEEVWPFGLRATREQCVSRMQTFPEGIFVAEIDGETLVGTVMTQIIKYEPDKVPLSWNQITDNGFIKKSHNPGGDTLYGVDLSCSRFGGNSSKILMEQVGKLIISLQLKRGILGGRIPRYYKFADKMSAEEYINAASNRRRPDPELIFYTKLGCRISGLIPEYIDDPESCNYGVLLIWDNPFYGKPFPKIWSRIFKAKY